MASPRDAGPAGLAAREAAAARREEQWLADARSVLARAATFAGPAVGLQLLKPFKGAGATSPAEHPASPGAAARGLERHLPLEGLASDGSAGTASAWLLDASGAPGGRELEDAPERYRVKAARFLAWQQAQAVTDLARRAASIAATRGEVAELHEELREVGEASRAQDDGRRSEEARLRDEEQRCMRAIEDRWRELDEREEAIRNSSRVLNEAAAELEERGSKLREVRRVLSAMNRQTEQLSMERSIFRDQLQDVEAREAALDCMEEAWGSSIARWCGGNIETDDTYTTATDAVALVRETVVERMLDLLPSQVDPRLQYDEGAARAVILRSIGGSLVQPDIAEPQDDALIQSCAVLLPSASEFVPVDDGGSWRVPSTPFSGEFAVAEIAQHVATVEALEGAPAAGTPLTTTRTEAALSSRVASSVAYLPSPLVSSRSCLPSAGAFTPVPSRVHVAAPHVLTAPAAVAGLTAPALGRALPVWTPAAPQRSGAGCAGTGWHAAPQHRFPTAPGLMTPAVLR